MRIKLHNIACIECGNCNVYLYENGKLECNACGFSWYDETIAKTILKKVG